VDRFMLLSLLMTQKQRAKLNRLIAELSMDTTNFQEDAADS
jgi:hypothetical protein